MSIGLEMKVVLFKTPYFQLTKNRDQTSNRYKKKFQTLIIVVRDNSKKRD